MLRCRLSLEIFARSPCEYLYNQAVNVLVSLKNHRYVSMISPYLIECFIISYLLVNIDKNSFEKFVDPTLRPGQCYNYMNE